MRALIMAGGRGARLQMGEKSLVRLCEKPLIEYVLTAVEEADLEPVVVTTPQTPYTSNYCRVRGVDQICTRGAGYIEDMVEAVTILEETGPILIICADLPGITAVHLHYLISKYVSGTAPACSAWIPTKILEKQGGEIRFTREINGISAAPVGVNILVGNRISEEQEEMYILLEDPSLAFNVNTRPEFSTAEEFFSAVRKETNPEGG